MSFWFTIADIIAANENDYDRLLHLKKFFMSTTFIHIKKTGVATAASTKESYNACQLLSTRVVKKHK